MNNNDLMLTKLKEYPDIMTIDHASKYLMLSKAKVYNMLTSGELKGCKMGKAWRISKENLIDYMKEVGLVSSN